MPVRNPFLASAVVLYFVMALEILIMISPFAGFFYAAFNPLLLKLGGHGSTRWLTAFYLPHLVLPDDRLLVALRVAGSVLLVAGALLFLVCAVQVYAAKLLQRGAVLGGAYTWIRHPQYAGLALAGAGLGILWPRFLTAVLWLAMALVYLLLAKDEERRMTAAFPDAYRRLRSRTGMFLPAGLERPLTPSSAFGRLLLGLGLSGLILALPFLLRAYTVRHLHLWTGAPDAAVLAILPEDRPMLEHRMGDLLGLQEIRGRMAAGRHYLVYFLPREYVMQGMIADTGPEWRLFERNRTLGMILDWVFHPFGHLRGGHHHGPAGAGTPAGATRRLIFLSIEGIEVAAPADLFAIRALRVPAFLADVDVHGLRVLEIRDLPHGSGWGTVPTPVF